MRWRPGNEPAGHVEDGPRRADALLAEIADGMVLDPLVVDRIRQRLREEQPAGLKTEIPDQVRIHP